MLPAYANNYWVMLYFVSYLVFGLYLLMNFLLANVFNKFRDRLEEQACKILEKTEKLLTEQFNKFD